MSERPVIVACAALVSELRAVLAAAGLVDHVEVELLPAPLHNRPERIVPAIDARLSSLDPDRPVLLGYADCGTGGALDRWIDAGARRVARLPGAHCYEFFAGAERFAALHDDQPGTLYLTDFLAKHFDALVWAGLGLDRRPELRDTYFGNYTRVVLLAQARSAHVEAAATAAAERLGLPLVVEPTGLDPLAEAVRVRLGSEVGR